MYLVILGPLFHLSRSNAAKTHFLLPSITKHFHFQTAADKDIQFPVLYYLLHSLLQLLVVLLHLFLPAF